MLLGYKPLPWEANPAMISQHVHSPAAGRLIRHLLQYALCSKFDRLLLVFACELVGLEDLLGLCLFLLVAVCESVCDKIHLRHAVLPLGDAATWMSTVLLALFLTVCDRCSSHVSYSFCV